MSEFHVRLDAVHAEVLEAGHEATETLDRKLSALAGAALPEGVRRLPTARMCPGPHLAPQEDVGATGAGGAGGGHAQPARWSLVAR
ncbi:hypothetical protein DLJ49_14170 [Rhodovulum sp. 12E13]|uniref:hypothetical protein n=1 Tax=Rhodovulum sp. 12E13 TaxID=2203891 RepID=UPI000E166095|nr:hypothetical protein [Rhodovulum sp. 12E13]RDC71558.1 hypothetical protein DLJ49_14170 [Rhodovulum sp. 12E13]